MKKLALHWQIIIGLTLGLVYGIIAAGNGWGSFTSDWIAPFGTIFMSLLKLIAVPLVLASLILAFGGSRFWLWVPDSRYFSLFCISLLDSWDQILIQHFFPGSIAILIHSMYFSKSTARKV